MYFKDLADNLSAVTGRTLNFTSRTGQRFLRDLQGTVSAICSLSETFWSNPDTISFTSRILYKMTQLPHYDVVSAYVKATTYGYKVGVQRNTPKYVLCSYLVGYMMCLAVDESGIGPLCDSMTGARDYGLLKTGVTSIIWLFFDSLVAEAQWGQNLKKALDNCTNCHRKCLTRLMQGTAKPKQRLSQSELQEIRRFQDALRDARQQASEKAATFVSSKLDIKRPE